MEILARTFTIITLFLCSYVENIETSDRKAI